MKYFANELLFLDIRNYDFGIAHLYEHIFVQGFYDALHRDGVIDGVWGWVNGTTFAEVMFIEAGFYNKEIHQQFVKYLNTPRQFDEKLIELEIERMSIENRSAISYDVSTVPKKLKEINAAKLSPLLGEIDVSHKISTGEQVRLPKSKYLTAKKARKDDFTSFSVSIGINNPSILEKEIFLRLNAIAGDVAIVALDRMASYGGTDRYGPIFSEKENFIFECFDRTVRKADYDENVIRTYLEKTIKNVSFRNNKKALEDFMNETNSKSVLLPLECYRTTGILASSYHIRKLFTPKNVQDTWDKLSISIERI